MSATNSISDSNSRTFAIIKESVDDKNYMALVVTIHVVLFE
jgi:hypothetical protein